MDRELLGLAWGCQLEVVTGSTMTAAAVSVRWKPAAMQAFFLPVDDRCVRAARSLRTGEIVDVGDSYKVNLQCITRDDADVAAQGDWKMAGFQAATAAGPSMA